MKNIIQEIEQLKRAKNALILAHNYQLAEIQDIADFTGDSLELSRKAANVSNPIIVFCGVRFMAETAAILNPDKKILIPNIEAGCPMADNCQLEQLQALRKAHPKAKAICYINTNAEIKAHVDCCCTSGNAFEIVDYYRDEEIIFVPDVNLGSYIQKISKKELILSDGCCPVHNKEYIPELEALLQKYPEAVVMVHPETPPQLQERADLVLSTGKMLSHAKESLNPQYIVGTENGILHTLRKQNPEKEFMPLSENFICEDMKKIDLELLLDCLKNEEVQVNVPQNIADKARNSIEKMLEIF